METRTKETKQRIIIKAASRKSATKNFSPSFRIEQGGYGTVYKVKLRDGSTVAVKRAKKAIKKFTSGGTISVLDPKLERNPANNLALEKVLEMAFQCLAPRRDSRPSMEKCSEILWGIRKDYRELLNTSH
ncbi:hypothetical protein Bca4012_063991 [Brassica carinata]